MRVYRRTRTCQRYLDEGRRQPDQGQQPEADPGRHPVGPRRQLYGGTDRGGNFEQHDRRHHPAGTALMRNRISAKAGIADEPEKWVVNHLHEPDETGHEEGGTGVQE